MNDIDLDMERQQRRLFLQQAAASVGLVLCAGSVASILTSCETTEQAPSPSGKTVTFLVQGVTELEQPGGIVQRTLSGLNSGGPVFISRISPTAFAVFSSVCTHAGCVVNVPHDTTEPCIFPCHGSTYSRTDGKVLTQPFSGGRATDLPTFASTFDATTQQLTINT